MNNEIVEKLQNELEYTRLEENIKKLFAFITSDKVSELPVYHRILLENQLHAMNIYYNMLALRLADLTQDRDHVVEKVEPTDDASPSN